MHTCPSCDHVLQDNDLFCRHCGTQRPAEQGIPAVNNTIPSVDTKTSGSDVSMATFVGLILLFMIPVVGLIAAVVLSFFVKKNETIVNFSRAALIVIAVMTILQYIFLQLLASLISFIINQVFAGVAGQLSTMEPTISAITQIIGLFVG